MKKILLLSILIAMVCTCAFAGSWSAFGGTSIYNAHVGMSFCEDRWEYSGTFHSLFPNMGIMAIVDDAMWGDFTFISALDHLATAFVTAGAFETGFSYDVIPSERFDLDLGLSTAAVIAPPFFDGGVFAILSLSANMRFTYNFGEHSGIYIASGLPAFGLVFDRLADGVDLNITGFFTSDDDLFGGAVFVAFLSTRLGYIYRY